MLLSHNQEERIIIFLTARDPGYQDGRVVIFLTARDPGYQDGRVFVIQMFLNVFPRFIFVGILFCP